MNPDMNKGALLPEKEPAGAMISIIIVALVIIAGAYYFLKRVPVPEVSAPTQEQVDATTAALSAQGTSDDIADIQKDINATPDITDIGTGLGDIQL